MEANDILLERVVRDGSVCVCVLGGGGGGGGGGGVGAAEVVTTIIGY